MSALITLFPNHNLISRVSGSSLVASDGTPLTHNPSSGAFSPAFYVKDGAGELPNDATYWTTQPADGVNRTRQFELKFFALDMVPDSLRIRFRTARIGGGGSVYLNQYQLSFKAEDNPALANDVTVAQGTFGNSTHGLLLNPADGIWQNTSGVISILEANRTIFESAILFNNNVPSFSGGLTFTSQLSSGVCRIGEIDLLAEGVGLGFGGANLYIISSAQSSESLPLHLHSEIPSGEFPLFTAAHGVANESLALVVDCDAPDLSLDTFIHGRDSEDSSLPFFIASQSSQDLTDLFVEGVAVENSTMNLVCHGGNPITLSGLMPLSIHGGQQESFAALPLTLANSQGFNPAHTMNLVLEGPAFLPATSHMNMVIKSEAPESANTLNLFLLNEYAHAESGMPLFIQSQQGTMGAVPFSGGMNLFISRDSESLDSALPLFLAATNQIEDSGISLTISGQDLSCEDSLPLAISAQEQKANSITCYVHGI